MGLILRSVLARADFTNCRLDRFHRVLTGADFTNCWQRQILSTVGRGRFYQLLDFTNCWLGQILPTVGWTDFTNCWLGQILPTLGLGRFTKKHPPEPPLDCWDYRCTVPATKKYSGTNPQSTGTVFPWKKLVLSIFSVCVGATDVRSRSSFRITTCSFFSVDVGETIDRVLTTHPLQTVIKLSFVASGSKSFRVHCFGCWTSPAVILFSGSFHLLQDPGYRVWSLASHTKCSVSASTWYRRLYFLPVQGKHLPVKTGTRRSSGGSDPRPCTTEHPCPHLADIEVGPVSRSVAGDRFYEVLAGADLTKCCRGQIWRSAYWGRFDEVLAGQIL